MLKYIVYEVIDYDHKEHVEYVFAATAGEAEAKGEMYYGMTNAIADIFVPSRVCNELCEGRR